VNRNQLRDNQGPGLTLEQGLDPAAFADNPLSGNTGKPLLANFNFQATPPPQKPSKLPAPR
jgi:hypothetical protein